MTNPAMPLITTVIPTYRRPQLLKRAIQSVLAQTYPHIEVRVFDNASGDDTAEVVAKIAETDSRVRYLCHTENLGSFENFQRGLAAVETPFFSLLSDDDWILPQFYETAMAGFDAYPEAMFSATDVIRVDHENNVSRQALESWDSGFFEAPDGLMEMLERGHSEWTGIVFRKQVIEDIGLLDKTVGIYSDLDFTMRIAAHHPFVVTKKPCAVFNSSTSDTRNPFPFDLIWPGMRNMINNLVEDQSLPSDIRKSIGATLWTRFESKLVVSTLSYLSRGNPTDAQRFANLLRDQYGGRKRHLALTTAIRIYKSVPFARFVFEAAIKFRRRRLMKKLRDEQNTHQKMIELSGLDSFREHGG